MTEFSTIDNEINRINENIADSYDVAEALGATMPLNQNSDNLATTLASIDLTVDDELSPTSEHPVQNKVVTNALNGKADKSLSNLTDAGKIVSAKMSMPSNTYEDITVGVSMAELTAPSDGWVVVTGEASAQGQYLGLYRKVGKTLICFSGVHSRATRERDTINIQLAKGDTFAIAYTYDSVTSAKFFYAKGSESEYVSQGE